MGWGKVAWHTGLSSPPEADEFHPHLLQFSPLNEPLPPEESLVPGHFGVKSEQVAKWGLRPAGEGLAELGGKEPRVGKERAPKGHEGA